VNRVALCDTEPIAIEGLRSLLESSEELSIVATEGTLADGMDAVRELRPSILMVDKAFGTQPVLDCLRSVTGDPRCICVIVWGSGISEGEALRYLRAGAKGVVRKTSSLDCILSCLRAVASGGTWTDDFGPAAVERSVRFGHTPLTSREIQVMELVERGLKNKDIGLALGIQTGTVKIHLKHIFEKTGIRGRYGLALSGLKEKGLLTVTM
jgi:two-component system, NarL family, nitrate/nitrite response regulator NarL